MPSLCLKYIKSACVVMLLLPLNLYAWTGYFDPDWTPGTKWKHKRSLCFAIIEELPSTYSDSTFVFIGFVDSPLACLLERTTPIQTMSYRARIFKTEFDDCPDGGSWSDYEQSCQATDETPINKGAGEPNCGVGNPINIATGNKFQAKTDYKGAGNLEVVRYFNGEALYDLGFGVSWASSVNRKLSQYGDRITVLRSDGYTEGLQKINGIWTADPDSKIVLSEDLNGFNLTEGNGAFEAYDLAGKLISEINRQGQATTYSYNAEDQLTTITGSFGKQLIITHNINGMIESITTPDNKILSYSYGPNDKLISFTNQNNKTRQYHYENSAFPNALTGITDENGNRYATWSYDGVGRAISSEHANGVDKTTLTYNTDGTTTVTNPLGKQTTYHFTTIHGVRKVTQVEGHPTTSCEGANKTYNYDANGNVSSKTDWNGVETTYTYDMARNLELTRTEASGTPQERVITTQWHADFRLPTKITESNKITEYTYDAQGRQLSSKVSSVQ